MKGSGDATLSEFSPKSLLDLIAKGESETTEFKARFTADRIVARDLVAFANTHGGVLIIGVGDGGELIGLSSEEANWTKTRLQKLASSLFTPDMYMIGATSVNSKSLVYLNVSPPPTSSRPTLTATGDAYTRKGTSTLKLAREEAVAVVDSGSVKPMRMFVAMSFREEEEPALADYFSAVRRAAQATRLPIDVFRIDQVEGDYEISQRIMDEIDRADIVLADFTLSPQNVYFEAGYARGRKLRIIQTARKGTHLQFDVQNWRTEFYRNATELEEKLIPVFRSAYNQTIGS